MNSKNKDQEIGKLGFLGTFDIDPTETELPVTVEWRGFGTPEDDLLLSNNGLFDSAGTLLTRDSYLDNIDYQYMQNDDNYFDTFQLDFNLLTSSLPLLGQNLLPKSAQSIQQSKTESGGKSWKDILGESTMQPPPVPLPGAIVPCTEVKKKKEKPREICHYWLNKNCPYGDRCWYRHDNGEEEKREEYHPDITNTECCICQDDVIKCGKRFGLMQNCSHLFCLDCIRNWRYSHIGDPHVRKCPLCRATSFYVIPSSLPIFDPEVKQQLIDSYKDNMSQIPCVYFNHGKGICPFGDSCFYSHVLENGQTYTPRMVMQPDGELRDIGYSFNLGDFLVEKTHQTKKGKKKGKKSKVEGDNCLCLFINAGIF